MSCNSSLSLLLLLFQFAFARLCEPQRASWPLRFQLSRRAHLCASWRRRAQLRRRAPLSRPAPSARTTRPPHSIRVSPEVSPAAAYRTPPGRPQAGHNRADCAPLAANCVADQWGTPIVFGGRPARATPSGRGDTEAGLLGSALHGALVAVSTLGIKYLCCVYCSGPASGEEREFECAKLESPAGRPSARYGRRRRCCQSLGGGPSCRGGAKTKRLERSLGQRTWTIAKPQSNPPPSNPIARKSQRNSTVSNLTMWTIYNVIILRNMGSHCMQSSAFSRRANRRARCRWLAGHKSWLGSSGARLSRLHGRPSISVCLCVFIGGRSLARSLALIHQGIVSKAANLRAKPMNWATKISTKTSTRGCRLNNTNLAASASLVPLSSSSSLLFPLLLALPFLFPFPFPFLFPFQVPLAAEKSRGELWANWSLESIQLRELRRRSFGLNGSNPAEGNRLWSGLIWSDRLPFAGSSARLWDQVGWRRRQAGGRSRSWSDDTFGRTWPASALIIQSQHSRLPVGQLSPRLSASHGAEPSPIQSCPVESSRVKSVAVSSSAFQCDASPPIWLPRAVLLRR